MHGSLAPVRGLVQFSYLAAFGNLEIKQTAGGFLVYLAATITAESLIVLVYLYQSSIYREIANASIIIKGTGRPYKLKSSVV